jgi:hypothetical protein
MRSLPEARSNCAASALEPAYIAHRHASEPRDVGPDAALGSTGEVAAHTRVVVRMVSQ